MASPEKVPRATTHNCLIPIAIPRLPIIPKMERTKFNAQWLVERYHNLGEMVGSAVDECVQSIDKTFKTLASRSPFVRNFINRCKNPTQVHCKIRRHTNPLSLYNFAAILPGDSVVESVVTNGITNFLSIYNTLLITRLILTWFPNSPAIIVNPLSTLCDPYLNIFRGIIPPLGGTLDLSPILAFFVLNAFTSTAAALPAELPKDMERTSGSASASIRSSNPTTKQKLWLKRQCVSCEDQSKVSHRD